MIKYRRRKCEKIPQIVGEMMMVLVILQFDIVLFEFCSEDTDVILVAVHAPHQPLILLYKPTYCVPANEQQKHNSVLTK